MLSEPTRWSGRGPGPRTWGAVRIKSMCHTTPFASVWSGQAHRQAECEGQFPLGLLRWGADSSETFAGVLLTLCLGQGRPNLLACPLAVAKVWEIWCCCHLGVRGPVRAHLRLGLVCTQRPWFYTEHVSGPYNMPPS